MISAIRVETVGEDVIISFAVRVKNSPNRLPGMSKGEAIYPEDFIEMHEKYGISVVLAYLRTWLWLRDIKVEFKKRRRKK